MSPGCGAALRLKTHGRQAARAAGVDQIHTIPGKHFFPEDQASALAERLAGFAAGA